MLNYIREYYINVYKCLVSLSIVSLFDTFSFAIEFYFDATMLQDYVHHPILMGDETEKV